MKEREMKNIISIALFLCLIGCATKNVVYKPVPEGSRSADLTLDVRGKTITTYMAYHAEKRLSSMKDGEVLELVTGNYEAFESDLRAWTRKRGYPMLEVEKNTEFERYYIEKATPKKNPTKVAMIISDPGLTTLLSPLGFSLAAALEGAEVHIYFQGPAVKMFEQGFNAQLSGWSRPFSMFARDQIEATGHSPPQEKLRQLRSLGAKLYICAPSLDYFDTDRSKFIFEDIPVVAYLTFMEIVSEADVQFFLQ